MVSKKNGFLMFAAAATTAGLLGASHAQAAPMVAPPIQDTYSYVAGASNYNAAPGATVVVPIYLKETVITASILQPSVEDGLAAAGFAVAQSSSNLPSSPSVFNTVAGSVVSDTTDFNGSVSGLNAKTNATSTKDTLTEFSALSNADGIQLGNNAGGSATGISGEVFLGTVSITAGQSGVTTFNVGEFNAAAGNTVTFNNILDMDKSSSSSPAYTGVGTTTTPFTVTVAPEPASLALFSLGGLGLLARRRRMA